MAISYRPYKPQQEMPLPAWLPDWLPKGHLDDYISESVDALDLSTSYHRSAGGGARNQILQSGDDGQGAGVRQPPQGMSYERMRQAEAELKTQIDALLATASSPTGRDPPPCVRTLMTARARQTTAVHTPRS